MARYGVVVLLIVMMAATAIVARPDTNLMPLGAPCGATHSKAGKGNPSRYAAFAIPCTPLQRLSDHS
jgi:hypothetical protein